MSDKGKLVTLAQFGQNLKDRNEYIVNRRQVVGEFLVDLPSMAYSLGNPGDPSVRSILGFIMGQALKDFCPITIVTHYQYEDRDVYDWEGEIKIIAAQYNSSVEVRREETE